MCSKYVGRLAPSVTNVVMEKYTSFILSTSDVSAEKLESKSKNFGALKDGLE